jgi:MerR family transcriptional regulator, light-induced transcriptional regulator
VEGVYSQSVTTAPGPLRIGEFARRVGVTPELLRAWERRYGLLRPVRSPGGFRLYTDQDAERVARMRRALDDGLSAAEAARAALERGQPSEGLLQDAAASLLAAIERYNEAAVHAVLDETLAAFGLEAVLRDVILPTLTQVGLNWEQGTLEISQEHFASNLIRGRLLSLARLWSRGGGPLALLACPPGEPHDISLLAFGLLLRSHGWRILFLGADTPISTLTQTAKTTQPTLAVLTSFNPTLLQAQKTELRRLAKTAPLVLSGPGASHILCTQLGVRRLDGDLIQAANDIAHTTND